MIIDVGAYRFDDKMKNKATRETWTVSLIVLLIVCSYEKAIYGNGPRRHVYLSQEAFKNSRQTTHKQNIWLV